MPRLRILAAIGYSASAPDSPDMAAFSASYSSRPPSIAIDAMISAEKTSGRIESAINLGVKRSFNERRKISTNNESPFYLNL